MVNGNNRLPITVLILAATVLALALRLPRLRQRPMHTDEAVHAIKFGRLLEEGVYTYDPNEYHGPTLNYMTLIPAELESAHNLADVDEFTLRIVPVFFGCLLVLLLLLIADGLGPGAAIYAAILTAVSPAMVFYSRYYIMEILLVCFSFGAIACGYRFSQNKNIGWAVLTGVFVGLIHATKETSLIVFGSMLPALLFVFLLSSKKGSSNSKSGISIFPVLAGLAAAVVVSGLFYSSFLSNPAGIFDAVRTYTAYLNRAGGNTTHIHPWYYYLKMLIYSHYDSGPVWTEALIVVLAVVGFVAAMMGKSMSPSRQALFRFIAFYTLILTAVYSAVPYKTPWCMLGFLHGMILLAGIGAAALVKIVPKGVPRLIIILVLFAASVHLAWQAYLGSYKFYDDSRNPYVYAHTTSEVFEVVSKVEEYAGANQEGRDIPIQVICPGSDYWPLPWYLRSFSNVAWWDKVIEDVPSAPLIICSDKVEGALAKKLYTLTPLEERQMYLYLFDKPYYVWLRPQVKLLGFVRKDLWDSYRQQQAGTPKTEAEE